MFDMYTVGKLTMFMLQFSNCMLISCSARVTILLLMMRLHASVRSVGTFLLSIANTYTSILMVDSWRFFTGFWPLRSCQSCAPREYDGCYSGLLVRQPVETLLRGGAQKIRSDLLLLLLLLLVVQGEASWHGSSPKVGDALLVAFSFELLEVFAVWVKTHSGRGGLSFSCSLSPKDEVGCIVGCCGDVVCVSVVLCIEFNGCCIYRWDELGVIACS